MGTNLSHYYRDCRLDMQLSYQELARLCGYSNLTKGARRIRDFEQTGQCHDELLEHLTRSLRVDPVQVQKLLLQDDQAYQQWLAEPIAPRVIVRLMPAVYLPWETVESLVDQATAEEYCRRLAEAMQKQVALLWSRQTAIFFNESGRRVLVNSSAPMDKTIPRLSVAGTDVLI